MRMLHSCLDPSECTQCLQREFAAEREAREKAVWKIQELEVGITALLQRAEQSEAKLNIAREALEYYRYGRNSKPAREALDKIK